MFSKKRIYMDFASATPLSGVVRRELIKALDCFGNPSAAHEEGRAGKTLLEDARRRIATSLSVKPETLIFTGSGTESNNLGIRGVIDGIIEAGADPRSLHIVSTRFEHPSVLKPLKALERMGASLTLLTPNSDGIVTPEAVLEAIQENTVLISVCAVQGEIGVLQPIAAISRAIEEKKTNHITSLPHVAFPLLHTDASQGGLFDDLSPHRLRADVVTYDAQKIMGPKGVGVLYRASHVPLAPVLRGGSQERGVRPGTENVPLIVAASHAFEEAKKYRSERRASAARMQQYFLSLVATELPECVVTGSLKHRTPNNVHLSIPNVDGDFLSVLLDKEGIASSPRSACVAAGSKHEHALFFDDERSQFGTVRFTYSPSVTKNEVRRAVSALHKVLPLARGEKK